MCTSLAFTGSHPCFGRNLDLEESFGEQIVITPRSFPLTFRRLPCQKNHYAIIGMAHVAGGVPLYAEAVNEKGLYMAGLNFPGNACYFPHADDGATEAAPYELIPWLLGQCATIEETKDLLERLRLLDEPFAPGLPSAPLHWHLSDGHTSLVLESMADGLHIHTDPVGVLTNNPPFDFHLTNLRQYLNLTAASPENRFHSALSLSPFGQGMGSLGLPGDPSPVSRFVRAAFYKWNSPWAEEEAGRMTQCFHVLDGVAMVPGSVRTPEDKLDQTTYSCCICPGEAGVTYYYKTASNQRICAVRMAEHQMDQTELAVFPLKTEQDICWHKE